MIIIVYIIIIHYNQKQLILESYISPWIFENYSFRILNIPLVSSCLLDYKRLIATMNVCVFYQVNRQWGKIR